MNDVKIRDYFAGFAMQQTLLPYVTSGGASGGTGEEIAQRLAKTAYKVADAMIKERGPEEDVVKWLPIDTAPTRYQIRILAYPVNRNNGVGVAKRLAKFRAKNTNPRNLCWKNDNNKTIKPTHWMPLPLIK